MGILLQIASHADAHAMEQVFTLKDVIYLGAFLISAVIGYTKLQSSTGANAKAIREMKSKHTDDILHIQNGKRAIKSELIIMIKEYNDITNKRIDKTQEKVEKMQSKSDAEFKEVNEKLNRILGLLEKQ